MHWNGAKGIVFVLFHAKAMNLVAFPLPGTVKHYHITLMRLSVRLITFTLATKLFVLGFIAPTEKCSCTLINTLLGESFPFFRENFSLTN